MIEKEIPNAAMKRMPAYLHYLRSLHADGSATISSSAIAAALKLGEVQVRKDLAVVSGAGKPKIGYYVAELITHIELALGSGETTRAVIVGAGKLGKALLCYDCFHEFGIDICAAFDRDEQKCGKFADGKEILPMSKLNSFCSEKGVKIGIIAVPEKEAQSVCDALVQAGMAAIWNFAPVSLTAPADIRIKDENLAASLAVLTACL